MSIAEPQQKRKTRAICMMVVVLIGFGAGCGSDEAAGPDGARTASQPCYDQTESRSAVERVTVLCANDTDVLSGASGPRNTAESWTTAVNAESWRAACEVTEPPPSGDCESVLRELLGTTAGTIRVVRLRRTGDVTTVVTNVDGLRPTIRRRGGRDLVHLEYAAIK